MKSLKLKHTISLSVILLLSALMFVLLLPFTAWGQGPDLEEGQLSGNYAGTVAISSPVSLGLLDLVFEIDDVDGVLAGAVSLTQTQVFLAAPALHGSITSSPDAITPTFRLDSEVFTATVSGREVVRHFSLVGEALNNGDVLRGQYEETIEGFTPNSLLITGAFLVVRPSRALTGSVAPAPIPTPGPPGDQFIYLPLILR